MLPPHQLLGSLLPKCALLRTLSPRQPAQSSPAQHAFQAELQKLACIKRCVWGSSSSTLGLEARPRAVASPSPQLSPGRSLSGEAEDHGVRAVPGSRAASTSCVQCGCMRASLAMNACRQLHYSRHGASHPAEAHSPPACVALLGIKHAPVWVHSVQHITPSQGGGTRQACGSSAQHPPAQRVLPNTLRVHQAYLGGQRASVRGRSAQHGRAYQRVEVQRAQAHRTGRPEAGAGTCCVRCSADGAPGAPWQPARQSQASRRAARQSRPGRRGTARRCPARPAGATAGRRTRPGPPPA